MFERLKTRVEKTLGYKLQTPKDFTAASAQIFAELKVMLSSTTLKRLWGYLRNDCTPRIATLNILSRFVGYDDWSSFVEISGNATDDQSNLILSRHLEVSSLKVGDCLLLTWLPNRRCKVRFLGDRQFAVIESVNAKLVVGDTFECSVFIEGQPLYVDHLKHCTYEGVSYVAGKNDGIRFTFCED